MASPSPSRKDLFKRASARRLTVTQKISELVADSFKLVAALWPTPATISPELCRTASSKKRYGPRSTYRSCLVKLPSQRAGGQEGEMGRGGGGGGRRVACHQFNRIPVLQVCLVRVTGTACSGGSHPTISSGLSTGSLSSRQSMDSHKGTKERNSPFLTKFHQLWL